MPRFAPVMSVSDLQQVLIAMALEHNYAEDYGPLDPHQPDMARIIGMLMEEDLLPHVVKDWAKVDFSTENLDVDGHHTTKDGIPYLALRVGGDWETPLVAIVYFDGKRVRGFVPTQGNTFNHATKKAFGNDSSDAAAAQRQFGYTGPHDCIEVNPVAHLIEGEINTRLAAKGTYAPSTAPVVSKATRKAQQQALIEQGQDLSGPITAAMVYAVIELAAGGAYISFKLRSSGRTLTKDEAERLVGVPTILNRHSLSSHRKEGYLWYTPMGCYPAQAEALLKAAGFTKAPDNDISMYAGARTHIIRM